MKVFLKEELQADTIARELGSSGVLRGHWPLIKAVSAKMSGMSTRKAIHIAAEECCIEPKLARERIRGVILFMEKKQTEEYRIFCVDGKRPSPNELIERLALIVGEQLKEIK